MHKFGRKEDCGMAVNKLVVGLAGMPGAGKSVVVNVARAGGYGVVVMGWRGKLP